MLASQRTQETGCYIVGSQTLDSLPAGPVFWHLYTYPTLDAARTQARGSPPGLAVESLGKFWLFKIAPADWHPTTGERVAVVGPLSPGAAKKYEARYLEVVQPPHPAGHTPVHRHPGVEAWFVVSGHHCEQTPGRTRVVHAGETGVIAPGVPMMLTPGGGEHHLTLVLFDAGRTWMSKAADWKPEARCPHV